MKRWLDATLPKHELLAGSVASITENLLKSNNIDYLAVTSRVKDSESTLKKIKRKNYKDPSRELTDLSGVRVIVFFESGVERVSDLIREAFNVDDENSSNKDAALSVNQIGYRSVHFVCDLGAKRAGLPEYEGLEGLKFEFQVRTVLQHAWAELAHDRNYKFSGKLPKAVERKLYLYAGMLEIADKGFDELSREIDSYIEAVQREVGAGDLDMEINSINLSEFIDEWSRRSNFTLEHLDLKDGLGDLVEELRLFGVSNLAQLNDLIPSDYVKRLAEFKVTTTIYGVVRDWMLISDWQRYQQEVPVRWRLTKQDDIILKSYLNEEDYAGFLETFRTMEGEYEFDHEYVDDRDHEFEDVY